MWTRRLLGTDPFDAARRLRPLGGLAFLDSATAGPPLGTRSCVAAAPFLRYEIDSRDGDLAGLGALLSRYRIEADDAGAMAGAAIGAFSYDLAHRLERLSKPSDWDDRARLASFGLYGTVLTFDHLSGHAVMASAGFSQAFDRHTPAALRREEAERQFDRIEAALSAEPEPLARNPPVKGFRSDFTRADYERAIARVRDYIRDGDIYQANIAQSFSATLPDGFDALAFHSALRRRNPAPFAAYLELPGETIVSSSPERFVALSGDRIETRPIKGTARRSPDPTQDGRQAEALLSSVKDRAENVMIVDLLRNDLSRVAVPDTVEVPVLCGLESYASVHHLVSVVTARLRPGLDALDIVAACFPGGSITGAPKIRAMDIITELERRRRGVYCGCIGYLGFDGSMDLNIAIRTVSLAGGRARLSAGGGITILSDPQAEYDESLAKASRLLETFEAGS